MTDPINTSLLEDEDGAPYPEAVQKAHRDQLALRAAIEAVRDDFTGRGDRLRAKGRGNGSIRDNERVGRASAYLEVAREITLVLDPNAPPERRRWGWYDVCTCVTDCAEDPATACSLSGEPHVHPDNGEGTFGPCPFHPDAPGDH